MKGTFKGKCSQQNEIYLNSLHSCPELRELINNSDCKLRQWSTLWRGALCYSENKTFDIIFSLLSLSS